MDNTKRQEIAAFRYQLIAGVINRATPLMPGEISAYFKAISQNEWTGPEGIPIKVSIRTLERYKQYYEQGGFEALMPKCVPKRGTTALSPEVLEEARKLRIARPDRSVEQIIFILEANGIVEKGKVSQSTLGRYFRREGLLRQQFPSERNKDYGFRRFEADVPHRLWQADFHHTLYLPDPIDKKRRRKAKLCAAIDDYSRHFVHAQYYWDEKMPCLEDTLKKAIEKYGIPEQFYCDNGSAFSSKHLTNICGRLGVRLSHSKPYRPQGRGKIERVFQFVDTSFKPEAYEAIETGKIVTLEDLNKAFGQWMDGFYHLRKHGSTGESPAQRLASHPVKTLPYGKEELRRLFFVEEMRKVDKTGCISLNGRTYEVPLDLAGQTIQIRFDPFDIKDTEIYAGGILVGSAQLLDTVQNFHQKNLKKNQNGTSLAVQKDKTPLDGQLEISMLEAAQIARNEAWGQQELMYRKEGKTC